MASLWRRFSDILNKRFFILLALIAVGAGHEPNEPPATTPQHLRTTPAQLAISLQWDAVPRSMGYEIQRAASPTGPFQPLHNYLPQIPLYNDFVGEGGGTYFYRVRSIQTNSIGHFLPSDWCQPVAGHSESFDQDELVTEVQRTSFNYFYLYGHPVSGLARASAHRDPNICAIGASGMGFFNIGVGIERGFITRQQGADWALKELTFLSEKAQRFHGAFPHFINGETGKAIPFSHYDDGADIVETAFLIEGVLFTREYFSGTNSEEAQIRQLSDQLWRGVEWDWFVNKSSPTPAMIWHWSPNYGFKKNLYILGFNECQIAYVLALASPTHPIEPRSYWQGWESDDYLADTVQFGIHLALGSRPASGPPLFETQYSYLGMDPRQLVFNGRTYFDHFTDFCHVQILYAQSKSDVYKGYGPLWGITASAGPDGYMAFAPGVRDTGTIAPTAALASMPYVPEDSLSCLNKLYQTYGPKLWGPFGFYDSFNLTRDWVAKTYLCIDVGPIAPMIENYRSGLCWNVFMKCKEIQPVLKMLNDGENLRYQKDHDEARDGGRDILVSRTSSKIPSHQ